MAGPSGATRGVAHNARARIEPPAGPDAMFDFSISIWAAEVRQDGPRNRPLGPCGEECADGARERGDTPPADGFGADRSLIGNNNVRQRAPRWHFIGQRPVVILELTKFRNASPAEITGVKGIAISNDNYHLVKLGKTVDSK